MPVLPLLLASVALGADLLVCASGCDHSTIASAVSAAAPDDRVVVANGVWNERVHLTTANVEVRSLGGSWHATLAPPAGMPAIHIGASGTSVQGFTLQQADTTQPLVLVDGSQSTTLRDLTVFGHTSTAPIIDAGSGSIVQLAGSRMGQNNASHGLFTSNGSLTVLESELDTHNLSGGGLVQAADSEVVLQRSAVRQNFAPDGAVALTGGSLTVTDSLLEAGQAASVGASQIRSNATFVTIQGSSFWNGLGGSIQTDSGSISALSSAFHGPDGAVSLTLTPAHVQDSRFLSVDTPTFAPLTAVGSNLTVQRTVFEFGGGASGALNVRDNGMVLIEESAFVGNTGGLAGAIEAENTDGSVARSLFCDNTASVSAPPGGGAMWFDALSNDWTVQHSVFSRNSTQSTGGGALGALGLTSLTVDHNTFRNNTSEQGGEVMATNALTATITNNLLINPAADDYLIVDGGNASGDHNLWWFGGGPGDCINCASLPGANTSTVDPQLPSIDGLGCHQQRFDVGNAALANAGSAGGGLGATNALGGSRNGFADVDGDGYTAVLDCNDDDASVYPGAPELCDGVDNDCDRQIDLWDEPALGSELSLYPDTDHDGVGAPGDPTGVNRPVMRTGCEPLAGWSLTYSDCNDADFRVTGGPEVPGNGLDDDCDPLTPDVPGTTDTGDTGDTARPVDTADTGVATDTADSAQTDTASTDEPHDTGEVDTSPPQDTGPDEVVVGFTIGGAGCGCQSSPQGSGWLALLLVLGLRRRPRGAATDPG